MKEDKETANSSCMDRRTSTRVNIDIKLQLSVHQWDQEGSFSGQYIEGILNDLSSTGLQISSKSPLAQEMFVVIHFPKESKMPPITGKIIRIDDNKNEISGMFQYGCLLSGLAPFAREMLTNYIDDMRRKVSEEE